MTERSLHDYPAIVWMVWDDYERVDGYLCDEAHVCANGWVFVKADAYLWRDHRDDGGNQREHFDKPQRMSIPAHLIRYIEWKSK